MWENPPGKRRQLAGSRQQQEPDPLGQRSCRDHVTGGRIKAKQTVELFYPGSLVFITQTVVKSDSAG